MPTGDDKTNGPRTPPARYPLVRRLRSADLFRGGRRLIIEHADEEYCLRVTRNHRLILTKS